MIWVAYRTIGKKRVILYWFAYCSIGVWLGRVCCPLSIVSIIWDTHVLRHGVGCLYLPLSTYFNERIHKIWRCLVQPVIYYNKPSLVDELARLAWLYIVLSSSLRQGHVQVFLTAWSWAESVLDIASWLQSRYFVHMRFLYCPYWRHTLFPCCFHILRCFYTLCNLHARRLLDTWFIWLFQ